MQKLWNLDKWATVAVGEVITFTSDHVRTVRLEVNAQGTAELYVELPEQDDAIFLALVTGRDVIEWSQDGPFNLIVDGAPVRIYTADGQDWSVDPVDDATFTKVVERRARNVELETMMFTAMQNIERRQNLMAEENERRLLGLIDQANARAEAASAETVRVKAESAADGGNSGAKPEKAADGGAPDESASDAKS